VAETKGVGVKAEALASVRATEEENDAQFKGGRRPAVIGRPMKDEKLGDQTFDGKTEYMWFPGDPPRNLDLVEKTPGTTQTAFVRVMPPYVERDPVTGIPVLPHLNLGAALEFLIGDWLE
jgi:predicted YcjX-like family ATPase